MTTTALLPEWIEIVVPESQVQQYQDAVRNPIVPIPDDREGLGKVRNWCLDNFSEHSVIMVDDDIRFFYQLSLEKTLRITDPLEIVQILINTCVMARDVKASVFGFSQTDIRKYKGYDPFHLNGWVGTIIGVNGRKYRFRDDKFKVDIDYCLQALLVDRIIWMDGRYYASNNKDNNAGGNSTFRTEEAYLKSTETLKRKWGDCIKIKNVQTQQTISLTFARRQKINIE